MGRHDALSAFQNAVGSAGNYTLIFAKGQAPSKLGLDSSARISGLWFGNWTLNDDTPDTLLSFLGRGNVEAVAPARMRPFLSTLEMFRIKWGMPEKDRQAYLDATPDLRGKILDGLGPVNRAAIVPQAVPMFIDSLEWLATTRELCQAIYELKESPWIAINTGLVDRSAWSLAGHKGGLEPGVLNLTHVLRRGASGPVYAVSATVNDPAKDVDPQSFSALVSRLIGLIARGGL
jgi:hypothetical protein